MHSIRSLVLVVLAFASCAVLAAAEDFPRPKALEPDIRFWTRIYTEVSSEQGFIHDDRYLNIVYETVNLEPDMSRKARNKYVKKIKARYKSTLLKLSRESHKGLSAEEQRVLDLWPKNVTRKQLREAHKYLRFQLGQSDKFKEGLVRSGRWTPYIEKTLRDMELPAEIIALPHVESSFNPMAYSFVGAAGMWQFTRSTGRRFMRVDHVIDERLDPFIASVSAARLLQHNYKTTNAWPLAITAYNHGVSGMRRAAKKMGGTDIVKILRKYKSRTFKFASRNFYVAFLAAVDVRQNAEKYFGTVLMDPEDDNPVVEINNFVAMKTLLQTLELQESDIKSLNLALRPSIWRGEKYVPKGYKLRVPKEKFADAGQAKNALASIAKGKWHSRQLRDLTYRVRRGDSLSAIADRYRVSVRGLMAMNNLRNRHFIRVGQVLKLPQKAAVRTRERKLVDGQYTVQAGDSLSIVAANFGISENKLIALNNIKNRNQLAVGQRLRISGEPVVMVSAVNKDQVKNNAVPKDQVILAAANKASSEAEISNEAGSASTSIRPADKPAESVKSSRVALQDSQSAAVAERPAVSAAEMTISTVDKLEEAEPTSQAEADAIGPAQPAALHPVLEADPSNYAVSGKNTIIVLAGETLGHYADWLGLLSADLRRLNKMKYKRPVIIGKSLKLDFSRVNKAVFEQRRIDYHKRLQEAYFSQYRIVGTTEHTIKRGDSIWVLTQQRYNIPLWLLLQYNPDININKIRPGTKLVFPEIKTRVES